MPKTDLSCLAQSMTRMSNDMLYAHCIVFQSVCDVNFILSMWDVNENAMSCFRVCYDVSIFIEKFKEAFKMCIKWEN